MTLWIMEPRDPLLVRDGRPFGPNPGARATSLPFPFPSTLAGGIRTRAGVDENGIFQYVDRDAVTRQHLQRLKQLRVRGPLLVELTEDSGEVKFKEVLSTDGRYISVAQYFLPSPYDAFVGLTQDETTVHIRQLVPLKPLPGSATDLDHQDLLFVGSSNVDIPIKKPAPNAPSYWSWKHFYTWLHRPSELTREGQLYSQFGLRKLAYDRRQHVSIEPDKEVARDGMLFETSGLEFTAPGHGTQRLNKARRLALAIAAEDSGYEIHPGLTGLGGERRLSTWRKSDAELPPCSLELEEAIIASAHCRVILLTPACFRNGYRPEWLQNEAATYGVTVRLRSLAVQRPQVVSGWDLEHGRPKPSRRLAPAGSVLFLSLQGQPENLKEWIKSTWMQCISDTDEDRADGFGLAVLGTWSGESQPMERGAHI